MNTVAQKNELIFNYSSGKLGEAKSMFVSMYLFLNSVAAKKASIFDNILAENLIELDEIAPKKINYKDCIAAGSKGNLEPKINKNYNPLTNLIGNIDKLQWKSIYKGFKECIWRAAYLKKFFNDIGVQGENSLTTEFESTFVYG